MAKKSALPGTAVKASVKNFGGGQVTALAGLAADIEVMADEPLNFNYDLLDADIREEAIAAAVEIRRRDRDASSNLMAIGRRLERMKELLPGHFEKWVQEEFGYGTTMARQMMATAKKFGDRPTLSVVFAPSALRILSTDLIEMEAVEELAEVAQAENRKVTVKEAERVLKEARVRRGRPLIEADRAAAKAEREAAEAQVQASYADVRIAIANQLAAAPSVLDVELLGPGAGTGEWAVAAGGVMADAATRTPFMPVVAGKIWVELEVTLRDELVAALNEGKLKSVFNMGQVTRLIEQLGG